MYALCEIVSINLPSICFFSEATQRIFINFDIAILRLQLSGEFNFAMNRSNISPTLHEAQTELRIVYQKTLSYKKKKMY
jgi:hypothetical protein